MPHLSLDLSVMGPSFATVAISNVGAGPVLDAAITLTFRARIDSKLQTESRSWRASVIGPGERHRYLPPNGANNVPLDLDSFVDNYQAVTLSGTCSDVFGNTINISEQLSDLRDLWNEMKNSWHLVETDELRELRLEVEKLRKAMEGAP